MGYHGLSEFPISRTDLRRHFKFGTKLRKCGCSDQTSRSERSFQAYSSFSIQAPASSCVGLMLRATASWARFRQMSSLTMAERSACRNGFTSRGRSGAIPSTSALPGSNSQWQSTGRGSRDCAAHRRRAASDRDMAQPSDGKRSLDDRCHCRRHTCYASVWPCAASHPYPGGLLQADCGAGIHSTQN